MEPERRDGMRGLAGPRITRVQWKALVGTAAGWGLEGFDASLFTFVLVAAMRDLLGDGASEADIAFHAGLTISLFLGGWALGGLLFGLLSDYFGRVRVLMAGVLLYAVFTAASALTQEYWQLAVVRFIAGLGSGVEAPVGAALIAETWHPRHRARAIGVMASGYAVGYFLASLVYGAIGGHGWRVTLAVALVPAALVLFVRRGVREPAALTEARDRRAARRSAGGARSSEDRFVLWRLFSPPLLRRMVPCLLIATGALVVFWSTTTWTPQIITGLSGGPGPHAVAQVARATAMLNLGGVLGYASWGFVADAIGRRGAFLVSFAATAAGIGALYPFGRGYTAHLWLLPLVGFGIFGALGGNLVCFPELFPTSVRASALAASNAVGRLLTAPGPLVAGTIAVSWFGGDLGVAIAVMASFTVLGVAGTLLLPETRGRPVW